MSKEKKIICFLSGVIGGILLSIAILGSGSLAKTIKEPLGKWYISTSPKTVNIYLCGLKSYCKYKGIPFEIKKVKIQKESYVKNVMSIDQYNKLITSLKKDGKTQRVLRYKVIAETGARISEALQFKVRDFQQGYMRLYTKGKVRTIHIPTRLQREVLQTVEKEDPEEYIIKNRFGHKMTARGYSEGLIRDCEKCQIPKEVAHPHSLRHMFAVEFLKRNGNISLLADLLGHSGVNTTMIYTRLSFEEQIKQLNDAVDW